MTQHLDTDLSALQIIDNIDNDYGSTFKNVHKKNTKSMGGKATHSNSALGHHPEPQIIIQGHRRNGTESVNELINTTDNNMSKGNFPPTAYGNDSRSHFEN